MLGTAAGAAPVAPARTQRGDLFAVREFGAAGDGARLDTAAIQKAVDACTAAGGGTVWVAPGRYLTGTIVLKTNVTLHLDAGAVLLGSTKLDDYPSHIPAFRSFTDTYTERSLLYAEKARNIAITGLGRIDGQGKAFVGPYKVRPYMIRIIECTGVAIADVTMEMSAMWVQHYLACDNVNIRGIRVHSNEPARNNDGIDIDCCQKVCISDCEIVSGDDSIVIKSTADRPTRDLAVTNCVVSSRTNAIKLGTESNGGFQNIVISNCTVYNSNTGVTLQMVDGGTLERVMVSNIVMDNVVAPVFLRLGNRARPFTEDGPRPGMGKFRNVILSNIQADGAGTRGCAIAGIPGHPIENVTIENMRLHFSGGGKKVTRDVPEEIEAYPRSSMFGTLPAFGLYCRHVRGLRLRNIELTTEKPDERPPIVMEDVTSARPGAIPDYA